MKKLFCAAILIVIAFLSALSLNANAFVLPVNEHTLIASYLADYSYDDGGWLIDDNLTILASKSTKQYTISLDEVTGYEGQLPIYKHLDSAVIPIKDSDYIARGRFVCFRKEVGFMDKVIVVLLHRNIPEKAWIVKNRKLQPIPIRSVVCETEEHRGD